MTSHPDHNFQWMVVRGPRAYGRLANGQLVRLRRKKRRVSREDRGILIGLTIVAASTIFALLPLIALSR